jgi:uncharacterized protein YutE (UPF0331/DUF86 family)
MKKYKELLKNFVCYVNEGSMNKLVTFACMYLNDAINDERKAPYDYEKIIQTMDKAGILNDVIEAKIRNIISQEELHKTILSDIADRLCKK